MHNMWGSLSIGRGQHNYNALSFENCASWKAGEHLVPWKDRKDIETSWNRDSKKAKKIKDL